MGMTLACQYTPVAKPLQKPSEALLMNCASGSLSLHGTAIRALQLDSGCNCYWDEAHTMRCGSLSAYSVLVAKNIWHGRSIRLHEIHTCISLCSSPISDMLLICQQAP